MMPEHAQANVDPADGPGAYRHDCGHACCDERGDRLHDHFLSATDCPRCLRLLQDANPAIGRWVDGDEIAKALDQPEESAQ